MWARFLKFRRLNVGYVVASKFTLNFLAGEMTRGCERLRRGSRNGRTRRGRYCEILGAPQKGGIDGGAPQQ